ncbi:MAG: TonB-dependent receptor, partial [Ignavibacteria bacterium]|nr:TonB-dependent receptor [Ignavibacteria bacterium]
LPTDLSAVPGTKFSINADHSKSIFRFFGSIDPERKRNLNIGTASVGIQNLYMKEFIFDLNGGGDFTYLDDETFNETLLYANAFGRLKLRSLSINVKAAYQHQNLTSDSLSDSKTNGYFIRPTASLEILNKIIIEGGFTFSSASAQYLNGLYASVSSEVAKNFVLYGEYSPIGENVIAGKFLRNNFYYDQQNLDRVFLKKKNKFKALVKYEYDKYYQIDGGVEYFNTNNLPYYNNPDTSGFFGVLTSDAVSWNIFVNLLYYLGPYGYFYGTLNYFNVENSESKIIPYNPSYQATLIYGYNFLPNWNGEVKFDYVSDRYADLENDEGRKLPSLFNLGLKISYSMQKNFGLFFELDNIFNVKRDTWEGYQEKPFEALIGINYFFD